MAASPSRCEARDMTQSSATRDLAEGFVRAWNSRDMADFDRLFHPAFQWHIAVTEPNVQDLRPLHSERLKGANLPWKKTIYGKAETLEIFQGIFAATPRFSIAPISFTVEGDRAVVELIGDGRNQRNGRQYNNLYCYIFEIKDGQIVLFREYQDTLLLFDVWVAE
jgi:ketosteroid isomerase-like protein